MDSRAKQIEVNAQDFETQEQLIVLEDITLALIGGGCGEVVIG